MWTQGNSVTLGTFPQSTVFDFSVKAWCAETFFLHIQLFAVKTSQLDHKVAIFWVYSPWRILVIRLTQRCDGGGEENMHIIDKKTCDACLNIPHVWVATEGSVACCCSCVPALMHVWCCGDVSVRLRSPKSFPSLCTNVALRKVDVDAEWLRQKTKPESSLHPSLPTTNVSLSDYKYTPWKPATFWNMKPG